MAKEEDKGEKGDYEFIPPDFDEDAFIHKEMVSFKTTWILFVWGILAAAVTYGIFVAMDGGRNAWFAGLAVCAVFGLALKLLFPALKADIAHFGRREWFGTGALFFFTWLAFVVLMVNPPLADFADPRVAGYAQPEVQQAGGAVVLEMFAADNGRIDDVTFTLRQGPNVLATEDALERVDGHWRYTLAAGSDTGIYTWVLTATDAKGRQNSTTGDFRITTDAITFTGNGFTLDETRSVLVEVQPSTPDGEPTPACTKKLLRTMKPCLRTVRLEVEGGGQVAMEYDAALGKWVADSTHKGWNAGENKVKVVAVMADRFDGDDRIEGGTLVREGNYTVTVPSPGVKETKVLDDPKPPVRSVPGVPVVAIGVAVLGLAFIIRRKS